MYRIFPFLISVVLFSCCSPEKEHWQKLFNHKNLDGWDIKIKDHPLNDNFGNTFRVEDSLLKVSYDQYDSFRNQFGHIFYKIPYSRYKLKVEYRFVGDQAPGGASWAYRNSGIMLHSQSAKSMGLHQDFPISLEFQLLGDDGSGNRPNGNLCTPGTNVEMEGKLITKHCITSSGPTDPGTGWVHVEAVVYGDSLIYHIIEGDTVIHYSHPTIGGGVVSGYDPKVKKDGQSLDHGYIVLQSESHPVEFKTIELLNLENKNP